jgi:hypothetical protein
MYHVIFLKCKNKKIVPQNIITIIPITDANIGTLNNDPCGIREVSLSEAS